MTFEMKPEEKYLKEHTTMEPAEAVGIVESKIIEGLKKESTELQQGTIKEKNNIRNLYKKLNNLYGYLGISRHQLSLINEKEKNEDFLKTSEEIINTPLSRRKDEIDNLTKELRGLEMQRDVLLKQAPTITDPEKAKEIGQQIQEDEIKITKLREKITLWEESINNPKDFSKKLDKERNKREKIKLILEIQEKIERNKEKANWWESEKITAQKIITLRQLSTDFISIAPHLNIPNEWKDKYEDYLAKAIKPKATVFPEGRGYRAVFKPEPELKKEIQKNLKRDLATIQERIKKLQKEASALANMGKSNTFVLLQITHLGEIKTQLAACKKQLNGQNLNALLDVLDPYGKKKEATVKGLNRIERELMLNEIYREILKEPTKKITEVEWAAKKEEIKDIFPEHLQGVVGIILDSKLSLKPEQITPENTQKFQHLFNVVARYSLLNEEEIKSVRGQLLEQELNDILEEVIKGMGLGKEITAPQEEAAKEGGKGAEVEKTPSQITVSPEEKNKITSKLKEKLKGGLDLAGGLIGWSLLLALILIFYGLIRATDKAVNLDLTKAGGKKK